MMLKPYLQLKLAVTFYPHNNMAKLTYDAKSYQFIVSNGGRILAVDIDCDRLAQRYGFISNKSQQVVNQSN